MTIDQGRPKVLSVRDLKASFKGGKSWTPVVHGISFDLHAGETLAIVGESGSGKSVTSLAIMGLLPEDTARCEGSVNFLGKEVLNLPENEMLRLRGLDMAMVFQEPMTSLNPVYTISEQLGEAILAHRQVSKAALEQEVIQLLERVRIPNAARRAKDYPHHMSGGMRQRVVLAMALASNPKLLIADEPTTALDVTIQSEMLSLIADLQRDLGMAVLFITHDMGVVAEIADRTLVMYRGDVVEEGDTVAIFKSPREAYTQRLLASVPKLGDMSGKPAPEPFILPGEARAAATDQSPARRAPGKPVAEVSDMSVRFPIKGSLFRRSIGAVHAVEGVNFTIRSGETLSLVGESGSGKSTTGRALLRLVEAQAGEIRVHGTDVRKSGAGGLRKLRRRAQMIFQDPYSSLNPTLTVGDALIEPFVAHGLGTQREGFEKARTLLDQVGLASTAITRYPHEFSGGQRQRAAIARALMLDPDLIVADEAVSALDVSVKAQVCNLLLELQERLGLAYLFISHDMAIVERMSHQVAVMYMGEIVEIGPRDQVFGNPQHAYTRHLLSAVPVPDPAQRGHRVRGEARELKSSIKPVGYVPPKREWIEFGQGHRVMAS